METTFISIHDLSLDARLLYVSTSIVDILGYTSEEVVGKSCWEYFHPDEIPFAKAIHGRGIQLDKAAVLNYCQIKNRVGSWVGCECVFTIVHDVLVASTSIYRRGTNSQKRAVDAPIIRRLFSSSPRDPRYHMLSYISRKFSQEPQPHAHEPRAALFLNRFTRTLTIMYATNGLADVLGISAEELSGRSFYYCIQENCLQEAVRCLESAKANDSIAYLRFKFRDPRQDDQMDPDEPMQDGHSSEEDEDEGGVHLDGPQDEGGIEYADRVDSFQSRSSSIENQGIDEPRGTYTLDQNSRSSSGNSTDLDGNADHEIFDRSATARSSVSSLPLSSIKGEQMSSRSSDSPTPPQIEIEAVVSCTSDGLVVILRRARSSFPQVTRPAAQTYQQPYANGLFAAPWAANPIIPNLQEAPRYNHLRPFESNGYPVQSDSAQANGMAKAGPPNEDFMNSIRDVAVFAWSLTGINGSLSQYSRGKPTGESQPPTGLPIWDPYSNAGPESDRLDEYGNSPRRTEAFNIQNSSVNTERFPDFVDSTNSMQQAPWSPVHATGTANYEQDPQNFMGNLD